MSIMGSRWKEWELNNAYTVNKSKWIYIVALIAYFLVGYTWYKHFTTHVNYSWIISALSSVTIVKISTIIFNYEGFRKFASNILNDKNKMFKLNVSVVIFSVILIFMGIYLY